MDVIAEASTVGSRIIRPENPNFRPPARCGVEHERNKMRFRIVVLPEFAVSIGSGSIEIPER